MHRTARLWVLGAASLAALGVLAVESHAEAAPHSREQREAEARTACGAGRVEAGIELLAQLFVEYGHPNYIYNQARCYQQNGKAEQAISRFKEFLRAAQDISPDERVRVERFIKELESELPVPAPPTASPAVTETPARPPEAAVRAEPTPPPAEVSKPAAPPPERSAGLRTAAIALGAVAVAGLTTGIVSTLQVRSLQNEVETAKVGQLDGDKLLQQQKKADRYEALQWVGYGLGGAAAAGAVVCLILDQKEERSDRASVRLMGTISPAGRPGLVLTGRF
jgi:hypothetical protein